MAVVLSDSSSTQDTFTEPASSQDSTKRLFLEKRSNYSHSTIYYKDIQTNLDERGKMEEQMEQTDITNSAEQRVGSEVQTSPTCTTPIRVLVFPAPLSDPRKKLESTGEVLEYPQTLPEDSEGQRKVLIEQCITSFKLCLSRFPQHYKSLYRLAYLYTYSHTHQNLQWARDVLLGSSIPWQQLKHMPAQGLFYERNKTNFFNGIWRIPVDEIDRPGSFASHMNRSIVLLLNVLAQLKDSNTLLKISCMLQRTPDQGKKYLRDADRQVLAKKAFILTVKVLEDTLSDLTGDCQSSDPNSFLATSMTTDVSGRPTSEDRKDVPPRKNLVLGEGVAAGPENGGKETAQGPATQAMETGEARIVRETLKTSEPMDQDGNFFNTEKRADLFRKDSTKAHKEKGPEGPELSLEELSISARHHLPAGGRGCGPLVQQTEDAPHRASRKRKLLDDTEDSKNLLLEAYRVWQQGQKVTAYDLAKIENIMCKTYMLIKQVDEGAALEQAIKFCQLQMGAAAQKQQPSDTPTTPKTTKDPREIAFPLPAVSVQLTPLNLSSFSSENLLRLTEHQVKVRSVPATLSTQLEASRGTGTKACSTMSQATRNEHAEEPLFSRQDSRVCQSAKVATISTASDSSHWQSDRVISFASTSHTETASSSKPSPDPSAQPSKMEPARIKPRVPPHVPKLFIPSSSVSKFPPEITVTPPTPTLLSPKGSISEETKQKLKSVILSSQSAANVKKETLCQPALEILDTSSQESSLESDTDEDDDYMDI